MSWKRMTVTQSKKTRAVIDKERARALAKVAKKKFVVEQVMPGMYFAGVPGHGEFTAFGSTRKAALEGLATNLHLELAKRTKKRKHRG